MIRMTLTLMLIAILTVTAHAQFDAETKIRRLNLEVVELIGQGQYKKAHKVASKAVAFAKKKFRNEPLKIAPSYFNLAEALQAREKYLEAVQAYRTAASKLKGFEKKNGVFLWRIRVQEVSALAKGNRVDEAFTLIGEIEAMVRTHFEKPKEYLVRTIRLETNINIFLKRYEDANLSYKKLYKFAFDNYRSDSELLRSIDSEHRCFCYQTIEEEQVIAKKRSEFYKYRSALENPNKKKKPDLDENELNASNKSKGSLETGSALYLAQPEMRLYNGPRVKAVIPVDLLISKEGVVTKATATCGPKELRKAAETAAYLSRFKPTLLTGVPVETAGVIVYRFN